MDPSLEIQGLPNRVLPRRFKFYSAFGNSAFLNQGKQSRVIVPQMYTVDASKK